MHTAGLSHLPFAGGLALGGQNPADPKQMVPPAAAAKCSVLLPDQSYQGLTPLSHYRLQREQIRSLGSSATDCGPAELHFSITDPELLTNTTRELNQLREEKAKLEMQLHELQKVVAGPLAFCGGETGGRWGESHER